jgi:hypothetical protein
MSVLRGGWANEKNTRSEAGSPVAESLAPTVSSDSVRFPSEFAE